MPLSTEQKEFIQACVGHAFQLPTDAKQLSTEITNIRDAFSHNDAKPTDTYAFIQLPTQFILRLETGRPPITIREVQNYLLEMATKAITSAAAEAKMPLTNAIWNREQLQKGINDNKANEVQFKTVPLAQRNDDIPYRIPGHENRIYEARLITSDDTTEVFIKIDTVIQDEKLTQQYFHSESPHIEAENEDAFFQRQNAFLNNLTQRCEFDAEKYAIGTALEYLDRKKIITHYDATALYDSAIRLITLKTYLNLVIHGEITFSELTSLSDDQTEIFRNAVIIELIKSKKTTFNKIKSLPRSALEVISEPSFLRLIEEGIYTLEMLSTLNESQRKIATDPYYATLIHDKKLDISDIKRLSDNECRNLILPSAIALHKKNKLQLQEICAMTPAVRALISNQHYYDLLVRDKIQFQHIVNITDNQSKKLLTSSIITLITNQIISLNDALRLNTDIITVLQQDTLILQLVLRKLLPIDQVNQINEDMPNQGYSPFKPLPNNLYEKFKPYLNEFIQLASSKLAFISDLHYLHDHFPDMTKEEEKKESKVGSTANPAHKILSYQPMLNRCKTNIKHHLQLIIDDDFKRPVRASHNIRSLEKECKHYNISLSELKQSELKSHLNQYFSNPIKHPLTSVVFFGKHLNCTMPEIYQHLFYPRLLAIFEDEPIKIGYEIDSITKLNNDIATTAKSFGGNPFEIQLNMVKALIEKVKKEIEKIISSDKEKTHQTCLTLYSEITSIEKTSKMEFLPQPIIEKSWLLTYKILCISAKTHLMCSPSKHVETPYKASFKLFVPAVTNNPAEKALVLCNKIESVARFISVEEKNDKKAEMKI